MQQEIYLTSDALQDLNALKTSILALPISNSIQQDCLTHVRNLEGRLEVDDVEIEHMKYIALIHIQMGLLNESNPINGAVDTASLYKEVLKIEEGISSHVDTKILLFKIIVTLLDYNICLKYQIPRNFEFEELADILGEQRLWNGLLVNRQGIAKYLMIGLSLQYLQREDFDSYAQIYHVCVSHLIQNVHFHRSAGRSIQELKAKLLLMLHLHLGYKLLRRQFKLEREIYSQAAIYCLFYELEDAIIEKITYQYKRYQLKTPEQAIAYVKERLKVFMVDVDWQKIDDLELLHERKLKTTFKIRRSSSTDVIQKRPSSEGKVRAQSLSKIYKVKAAVRNQLHVPEKVNSNLKLKHRLELKKKQTLISNKLQLKSRKDCSIKNIQTQPTQEQPIITKKSTDKAQKQKLLIKSSHAGSQSFELNKKISISRTRNLQLLICRRPNNQNSNLLQVDELTLTIISQPRQKVDRGKGKLQSKKLSQQIAGIRTVQQKIEVIYDMNQPSKIYNLPPEVKHTLQRSYFSSFLINKHYNLIRQRHPFFAELSALTTTTYAVCSSIIKIHKITEENLVFELIFSERSDLFRVLRVDLKEQTSQQTLRSLFPCNRVRQIAYGHFFMGQNIYLHALSFKTHNQTTHFKHQVLFLRYQSQIYAYSAYLSTCRVTTHLIRSVIEAAEKHIDQINRQAEISFDYEDFVTFGDRPPKRVDSNPRLLKFWQFLEVGSGSQFGLVCAEELRKAMRLSGGYTCVDMRLLKQQNNQRYYLLLQNSVHQSQQYRLVLACRKIKISLLFAPIRSLPQLRSHLLQHKLLLQQKWRDVLFNRMFLNPPSRTFVLRLPKKGYGVYRVRDLVSMHFKLMSGETARRKWFFLFDMGSVETSWASLMPVKRENSRDRNRSQRTGKSRRDFKTHQQSWMICLSQQMRQLAVEGGKAKFCRQSYKLIYYLFAWVVYLKRKFYHCFCLDHRIICYKVSDKGLMYIQRYDIEESNDREAVFCQFRKELKREARSLKIVIRECEAIVCLIVGKQGVVAHVEYDNQCYRISIKKEELSDFHQHDLKLSIGMFKHGMFRKRVIAIVTHKLRLLPIAK